MKDGAIQVLVGEVKAEKAVVAEKIDFSNVNIEPLFEEMIDFDTFAKADYRAVKIEACEEVPKSGSRVV